MTDKSQLDLETGTKRQNNDYNDFTDTFIDNFSTDLFSSGVINEVTPEDLKKYFSNPDQNIEVLSNLTEYFYISTGEIHMLFELLEALPALNYRIESFDQPTNHDKYMATINKALHKVKHKTLTRDSLKQTGSDGTLTGVWLGGKNNLYPYIFDNPNYAFPAYRKNGEWVVQFDLGYLEEKYKDYGRNIFYANLSPYITKEKYDNFIKNRTIESQYIEMPQDRTFVVNTHTLKRNQAMGTGWANSALFDVLHKRKLKNVEQTIANKIINGIAILTIGSDSNDGKYANLALSKEAKRKIQAGVKKALTKSQDGNVPIIGIPEFTKLEFPTIKTDGLDGKKFEHTNNDIDSSLGLSGAVTSGDGGNNASGKLHLNVFYKRIGVLLENIETDMYQKMINIVLPTKQKDNYYMVYDKSEPMTTKEKIDVLTKLNDKGWSIKAVVDQIDGINFEQYLEQTLFETEQLQLQERLSPYKSSSTISSKDSNGAPEKSDGDLTDEGDKTRDGGKNDM